MDLRTLLEKLKLEYEFPEHLKRQDLFVITKSTGNIQTFKEELLKFRFINLITHFNSKCRNFTGCNNRYRLGIRAAKLTSKSKDNVDSPPIHPLDISTAVFLCCDPVARLDLVIHFWGCKQAFPLVVQTEKNSAPALYFWPLNFILGQNISHGDRSSVEKPISEYDLTIISIVRFRKCEKSKSSIVNNIISRSEKVHSYFFHHDCEGSVKKKSALGKGLIEAAPYFRHDTGPSMYLNLRGNVNKYPIQRQYLCNISNILILVCRTEDKENIRQLVHVCHQSRHCKTIIILFIDLGSDSESIAKYSDLDTFSDELPVDNHIIPIKSIRRPEMIEQICCKIDSTLGTIRVQVISDVAERLGMRVDENIMADILKKAAKTSKAILSEYRDHGKAEIFPIQGKYYLKWAKTDKEIHRVRKWNKGEDTQKYRQQLNKFKHECREKQYKLASDFQSEIVLALTNLLTEHSDATQTEIILRHLNMALENTTRSKMNKIYSEFKHLIDQMKHNEIDDEIPKRMTDLEQNMDKSALNICDVVREMGQIFEATYAMKHIEMYRVVTGRAVPIELFRSGVDQLRLRSIRVSERFPKAAIQLLLFGYAIEIMDGRSNSVPIDWVKTLFLELQNVLGEVSIKIISVLGIQSTGKSTLLNVMFGSQFAVGPGRCTRGVYMHLVKVSGDIRNDCLADYLLVIDTEGLYSSYMPFDQIVERDNIERELATFVIGLSNVTIINIMGENMSYLKDILPIAVHAFLRMDLVGLHPKCRILHHNVDRKNEMNLLEQSKALQNVLDQYTEAACSLEKERVRRFGEIIHFDILHSIDYFPPLFDSESDECISTGYSREAMILKDTLMKDQSSFTLQELTKHIECLWNAIKTDNFVYEFRNIIETEAQSVLDRNTCHMQWKVRGQIENDVFKFDAEIENCQESSELEHVSVEFNAGVETLIARGVVEYNCLIDKLCGTKLVSQAIQKFRVSSIETFETAMNEYKNNCLTTFHRNLRQKKIDLDILHGEMSIFLQIDKFILRETNLHTSHTSDTVKFEKFVTQIFPETEKLISINFEEDAVNAIYRYFPQHHAKIEKVLKQRPIRGNCLDNFSVSDNYWPRHMRYFTGHEQENIKTVVHDLIQVINLLTSDKNCNRFNQAEIFRTGVLRARNHPLIYGGSLNIKIDFEIDLAICVCGELISRLEMLQRHSSVIPNRVLKLLEQYFKSKYREVIDCQISTDETVENFARVLFQETEEHILQTMANALATVLKQEFLFLRSKHGLLCYVMIQLMEEEDCLPIYLRSPEAGTQCCLSVLFDTYVGVNNTLAKSKLDHFLEQHVTTTLISLRTKLEDGIKHYRERQINIPAPVMKTCIDLITSSLNSFLPINDIRKFEKDIIDETDPCVVLEKLVMKLKESNACTYISRSVKFSVLEKHYDTIRYETVSTILGSLIGCSETCQCCGEICSIGQSNHSGRHKAIMHRPTGFKKIFEGSPVDSPWKTCWEEVEPYTNVGNQFCSLNMTMTERWIIPVDVECRNNSYWKYMFATHITNLASKQRIAEVIEIPESWKTLTKSAEIRKMNEYLKIITGQEEVVET